MPQRLTIQLRNFSLHLIWIFALLETITVPLLVAFNHLSPYTGAMKTPWHGFIIAFLGAASIALIINKSSTKLKIHFNNHLIYKISPVGLIGFWSGLVLTLLFYFQNLFQNLILCKLLPLKMAILGFTATTLGIYCTFLIYSLCSKYCPRSAIVIHSADAKYQLLSGPLLTISLLAGLYEGIALPIINCWQLFNYSFQPVAGALTGLCGGITGSLAITLIGNVLVKYKKIGLSFIKN